MYHLGKPEHTMEPASKRETLMNFDSASRQGKVVHEQSLLSAPASSINKSIAKHQLSEARTRTPSIPQQSPSVTSPPKTPFPIAQPQSVLRKQPLLPQHQDPWQKYYPRLYIRQGGAAVLAKRIPSDGNLYTITESVGGDKQTCLQVSRQLQQSEASPVVAVIETFDWKDALFVISEYIDVSLAQVIAGFVAGLFTVPESEVAFVVSEVMLRFLVRRYLHADPSRF